MRSISLWFIGIGAACISGVNCEEEHAHFPLEGCSPDEIDLICLFVFPEYMTEESLCYGIVNHLLGQNKTHSRVMFAGVYDWFSVDYPNVNVSTWQLYESTDESPYSSNQQRLQEYTNVNETIELKVKFVERLFSEMGGVRENVTHIAVIFIHGEDLSLDESRKIPAILQKQKTDLKTFLIVLSFKSESQVVHLRDTLIVNDQVFPLNKHLLALAMCNQCLEGWWKMEHSVGAESISCYKMLTYDVNRNKKSSICDYNEFYEVTIESKSELLFLQTKIRSFLSEQSDNSLFNSLPAYVSIDLKPDYDIKVLFYWGFSGTDMTRRHLVVNHWLPGTPYAGSYIDQCVVWKFQKTTQTIDVPNVSGFDFVFTDGWVKTSCEPRNNSFALCEASLSRRIEESSKVRIKSATQQSFSQGLSNRGLVKFGDNIVSVSKNYLTDGFVQFLQETKYKMFPLFDCGENERHSRYISYSLVCDGNYDCANSYDEFSCVITTLVTSYYFLKKCPGLYCCDGTCLLLRFVNDGFIDCPVCEDGDITKLNDESVEVLNSYKINQTCSLYCDIAKCITLSQLNDGNVDCIGFEGPLDETIGKLEPAGTCSNQYGHIIWAPKCVYVRDAFSVVIGCRDFSHLDDCTNFECPLGYVKCPGTYCIPQHYVRDRKNDCPTGEDEQADNISPCTGNFACWKSTVCLYPDLVCDGHRECPYGDDEVNCNLKCPNGFHCVSGTVTVSSLNKTVPVVTFPSFDPNTKYIAINGLDLSITDFGNVKMPPYLIVLKMANCKLRQIDNELYFNLTYLQEVDISYNNLLILLGGENLFSKPDNLRRLNVSYNPELVSVKHLAFPRLDTLDLSHTSLTYLDELFILGTPLLSHLNLSFTLIWSFHKRAFYSSSNLQTLDLRRIPADIFYENIFNGLTVSQHLYADTFEMCCPQIRGNNILDYTCHSAVDEIASCFNLIGDNVQRVLLWVVAGFAVLGNVTVVVYRVIWDRSVLKTGYGLFVTNLGISDFIMGLYLFIIAGADYYYRGVYVLFDKSWRESNVCTFAGFLCALSNEMSLFCVFLMFLEGVLFAKCPFARIKMSRLFTICSITMSWTVAAIISLTPVFFRLKLFYHSAVCFNLPLLAERFNGWTLSFAIFIILNSVVCGLIAVGQGLFSKEVSQSRRTDSATTQGVNEDLIAAKQLFLLASSSLFCWVPIGCMGLLSVTGHEISNDVYSWTTLIVLPIHSAANPLLYAIPVLQDKWDKFKFSHRYNH